MDWKDVAKIVAPILPAAGSILGGLIPFPGGSLIGQKFGEIIAKQFGVEPTPTAVSEAIATAGEETVRAKINAAVERARIEIKGFVDLEKEALRVLGLSIAETNETMRAELGREHWFFTGWRPAIGWVFCLVALAFGLMLVWAGLVTTFKASDPLRALTDAWPLFAAYFGVIGLVVGVYIPSRSIEKKAAIEAGAPMPNVTPTPAPPKPVLKVAPRPSERPPPRID